MSFPPKFGVVLLSAISISFMQLGTPSFADELSMVSFLPCHMSEGTTAFVKSLAENPALNFIADRGVAIISYNSAQGKKELRSALIQVPDAPGFFSCSDNFQARFQSQGQDIWANLTVPKSLPRCRRAFGLRDHDAGDILSITSRDLSESGTVVNEATTVFQHQSLDDSTSATILRTADFAWGTHFSSAEYICKDAK
jgi:hypothetical protein